MKYMSEITKEFYNSEKECLEAEKLFIEKQKREEELKKQKANELSAQKKEASDRIEKSLERLSDAYDKYELAEKNAKEIYNKAYEKAKEILSEAINNGRDILEGANDIIKLAKKENNEAVADFNKKFGQYKVNYTGEKADKYFRTYEKAFSGFNSLFDLFDKYF